MNASPRFTVALAAMDSYTTIEQVHLCLEAQTIRPDLEIQLICRNVAGLELPDGFRQHYPDIIILEGGEDMLLNEAREIGVREASTPYVLILEDHCLPYADCLEHMLARLEEGWSAVGPAFVSGNTATHLGVSANLLTYGEWMGWKIGEQRPFISGFNSAFPVKVLLDRGERLTEDLVTPSTLQTDLAENGHRFYFEALAVMAHWESSSYAGVTQILMKNGRGMGMLRARNWPLGKKLLTTLANPLLMAHRTVRAARTWRRVRGCSWRSLLHLVPLSVLWTLGELQGYWSSDRYAAIEGSSKVESNRQRFVDSEREPIRKPY